MGPVGMPPRPNDYDFGSDADQLVADPLSDHFTAHWREVASTNASVYQQLFHCVPAHNIKTWDQYKAWAPPGWPPAILVDTGALWGARLAPGPPAPPAPGAPKAPAGPTGGPDAGGPASGPF